MSKKNPYIKNPSTEFKKIDKLGKKQAKTQIDQLREAIDQHDYWYYVKNNPKISDRVYDKLFHRLQELEDAFPEYQSEHSPTRRVGAEPVEKFEKKEHTAPMLSLDSALEEAEIKHFDEFVRERIEGKPTYMIEPKFDGLSVELVYEDGTFKYGITRGDGKTGEDISENLKTIGSVPLRLLDKKNVPDFLAVRGEVLMPKDDFQDLNKKRIEMNKDPFANPRNAAAGLVRQLDSKKVANKPLDIYFYQVLEIEGNGYTTHSEMLDIMSEWGFKINEHKKKCNSFKQIKKFRNDLAEKRDDLNYDIDGVVIKLNDLEKRKSLGTRQRNPRWAIAWKFPPKKEVTLLHDIVIQVGRTGMLTPVALLDPVDVGGVTVSRATLHNEDEVQKKDVRPGDKVRIIRAGDVIPEVVERADEGEKRGKQFSMPEKCPVCGTKVEQEGAYYFCPAGLSCKAQLKGRIIHYASRDAMDIENLGDKIVDQLVEKDFISDLADLYHLSKDDLLELDGFAEKSAQKLYDAIQETKKPRLDRFVYALGIRHVGQHLARVLAREYGTLDSIAKAKKSQLEDIKEVGSEIADSVYHFFKDKENKKTLDRLFDAGLQIQSIKQEKRKKTLKGKTFVFTGELDNYTRSEAEELVESLGGRTTSSVSGNTDFVVVGENPGTKYDDAKAYDIDTLNEQEFEKMVK